MSGLDEDLERLAARGGGVDDHHVVARDHDLVEGPLRDLEGPVDDLALLGRERLVDGDHVANLLARDLFALTFRVAAEQPDCQVGGDRQQPHDRLGECRQQVERACHHHAPLLGALHRDALRGELAEHECEVGEHQGDEDHRHRSRGPAEETEARLERCRERHGCGSRCEEARQRDADLDGGEELVRLTSEPGEDPAGGRTFLEALELALAQRHERELGAGERRVDQHENHHEQQLWPDVTHPAVIQACRSARRYIWGQTPDVTATCVRGVVRSSRRRSRARTRCAARVRRAPCRPPSRRSTHESSRSRSSRC